MPRPAGLVTGIEPRLEVRKEVYGVGWLAGPATGHWRLVSLGSPSPLDQQFVGGFLSGAARVPVPHSALFLIWQSLRRQAAVAAPVLGRFQSAGIQVFAPALA